MQIFEISQTNPLSYACVSFHESLNCFHFVSLQIMNLELLSHDETGCAI